MILGNVILFLTLNIDNHYYYYHAVPLARISLTLLPLVSTFQSLVEGVLGYILCWHRAAVDKF